jgi:hypothetical protein
MKIKFVLAALALAMGLTPNVFAQALYQGETKGNLTGSIWSEVGTISPIEKGNVIFATGVNEGFDFRDVGRFIFTPYVAAQSSFDSYGHDWNNTVAFSAGLKTSVRLSHGVISLNTGYGIEDRFKSHMFASGPSIFIEDWFGWQIPAKYKRYPGSTWTTFGYTSPVERGNIILYGHLQQGVVVARVSKSKMPIVLFGEGTLVRDIQHHDWNNLIRDGIGIQITIGHGVSIGTNYSDEHRTFSHIHAGGASMFVKFDTQWGKE